MVELYCTERLGGIFWKADLSGYDEVPVTLGEEKLMGNFPSAADAERFFKFNVRSDFWVNPRIAEKADIGAGI